MENLAYHLKSLYFLPQIMDISGGFWVVELNIFAALIPVLDPSTAVVLDKIFGEFVKTLIVGSRPPSFWFSRSGWGPRICISNKFPGDVDAAGLETSLWEPLFYCGTVGSQLWCPFKSSEELLKATEACALPQMSWPRISGMPNCCWRFSKAQVISQVSTSHILLSCESAGMFRCRFLCTRSGLKLEIMRF